jgi:endonuclease/exonuclease/phosphatase family metal-dependent hydrolase
MSIRSVCAWACGILVSGSAMAAWSPETGDWGKTEASDIRVMTWNVRDAIRRLNVKNSTTNNWHACARIVALLKPDVLVLQETADNGGSLDSVADLETTIDLFLRGGPDPFLGGTATTFVQLYAPGFDLPHVFVSELSDFGPNNGFNRNVVLSRFPFTDLNGDGASTYSDIPQISTFGFKWAPGGNGGIRGIQIAEIDLPDADYAGDLVVMNAHLKSGGSSSDADDRLEASQNAAWIIDEWFNGGGTGVPDPQGFIIDIPPATSILDPATPVVVGGDLNEDELTNGRRGPAAWLTEAEFTGTNDGADRDRTDSTIDTSTDLFGDRRTLGSRKLDYILYQDSIATLRRSVVFQSGNIDGSPYDFPPEFDGIGFPQSLSQIASDHLAVFADFRLPLAEATGACCTSGVCEVKTEADCLAGGGEYQGDGTDCSGGPCTPVGACCYACDPVPLAPCPDGSGSPGSACVDLAEADCLASGGVYRGDGTSCGDAPFPCQCPADVNGDGRVDVFDFSELAGAFGQGSPACATRSQGDLNCDGVIDVFDFSDLAANFGCDSD